MWKGIRLPKFLEIQRRSQRPWEGVRLPKFIQIQRFESLNLFLHPKASKLCLCDYEEPDQHHGSKGLILPFPTLPA